ncbi:class I SAM-dependent methyltransferase [Streptomyces sp. NPDC020875]|uniref:class I SAM-dependent methyltransferase n=1 Tax=Streptomyces sp. NPDC020875 TaxID=3154898 RepID=UPI0033D9049A
MSRNDHHGPARGQGHHHHDSTDIDWNVMAPLLEQGAELNGPLYREAAGWLAGQIPAGAVRRVLDVGSGPGVLTALLAEVFPYAEVVAVDATPELLDRAAERAVRSGYADRFRAVHAELPGDLAALGTADVVWAGDSLHHMGDQRAAVAGLAGLLRTGGLLAVVEGGLTARHLPRDIGIGRPGLEARLEGAHSLWFAEMRDALPGAKDEPEDWREMLAGAGLTGGGTKSFLLDLPAPLPEAAREHVALALSRRRESAERWLDADDLKVIDRLLDPDDPQGLANRPDVFLLAARTVHTARRG